MGRNIACAFTFLLLAPWAAAAGPAEDAATAKLYKAQCSSCHGLDGKGQTTAGKKLNLKDWTDGKTLPALSDEKAKAIIREGVKGPDGKQNMAPYKKLTDEQVSALVAYIRGFHAAK